MAAGIGGLGRTIFGGSSGGSNGNFFDGLNFLKRTSSGVSSISTGELASSAVGESVGALAKGGNALGTIFDKISNMTAGNWLGVEAIARITQAFFDDSEKILAEQFQDKLQFGYDELESLEERTAMQVAGADRRNAASSTFMGHTAVPAIAEGVNVEQGYQPRPAASYGEFHPTGLPS